MNAQFFIDHPEFYQTDTNGRGLENPVMPILKAYFYSDDP